MTPEVHTIRKDEELITRLVEGARPVHRIWPLWARLSAWLGLGLLMLGAITFAGLRPDVAERSREPPFAAELSMLLAGAVFLAALTLRAAVPGREPRRWETVLAVSLVVVAAALGIHRPMHAEVSVAQFIHMGLACAGRTFLIAPLPWCALMIALRRGAPLATPVAGALAGAASFVLAFGIMRAVCQIDELLHLVVWHGAPVLGGVVLSALVGFVWLPRWRRHLGRFRSRKLGGRLVGYSGE